MARPGNSRDLALAQERYIQRRNLLDKIKVGRGCADCGYNAHPAALDFDHRVPAGKAMKGGLGANLHRRWEWIEAEVAKCDVVCANCHRVRTNNAVLAGTLVVGRPRKTVTPDGDRLL